MFAASAPFPPLASPGPHRLVLARDWAEAWREVLAPWLRETRFPDRSLVVVPTAGQAAGLKDLCVRDGIGLVGVEFVLPGRLRARWSAGRRDLPPAMGRELLALGLRTAIARHLERVETGSADWGLLTSLATDVETALADFDALLAAGLGPEAFPAAPLRAVFAEVVRWVQAKGYGLGPAQARAAAADTAAERMPPVAERAAFWGLDAECRADWPSLVALARRVVAVTAVLPEPEFRGRATEETWIEAWERVLGVPPLPLPGGAAGKGGPAGELWLDRAAPLGAAPAAEVHVAAGPREEMAVVAEDVAAALADGAESVAVVFPRTGSGESELAARLAAAGLHCSHFLDTTGSPGAEAGVQHALLDFWARGARIEEFLGLWARLRALGRVPASSGAMRELAERAFDRRPSRRLADLVAEWNELGNAGTAARASELAARLEPWPEKLTLGEALARFAAAATPLGLPEPEGWSTLTALAQRDPERYPAAFVLEALRAFLPRPGGGVRPGEKARLRVALTTRRRAAALPWSRVIFVRANAGVWPRRHESSPWLPDSARRSLAESGALGADGWLPASDEVAWLERCGYTALARNAIDGITFTASTHDADDPETPAGPNPWLERVLLAQAPAEDSSWSVAGAWRAARREPAPAPDDAVPAPAVEQDVARWAKVRAQRFNPAAPFDEFFYCADPATMPQHLPARTIERAITDPVELWYEGVLGVRRVAWEPFLRARRRVLGAWVHRLMATALRGDVGENELQPRPDPKVAESRLAMALAGTRATCPPGADWDSLFLELAAATRSLLAKVYALPPWPVCAVEWRVPRGTTIPAGRGTIELGGRIDLVLLDRPGWAGARATVIDFKTGRDEPLAVRRMAKGHSLQLGLYLAAARSLGATDGAVWMLKPDSAGTSSVLTFDELDNAIGPPLERLHGQLATGRIGQLTRDRTEYAEGFRLPIACVAPRHDVLSTKWAVTFGTADVVALIEEQIDDDAAD